MSLRANAKPIVRRQRATALAPKVLLTVPKFANNVELVADIPSVPAAEIPAGGDSNDDLPEIDVQPWEAVADASSPVDTESLADSSHDEATPEPCLGAPEPFLAAVAPSDLDVASETHRSDVTRDSEPSNESTFAVKTLNPTGWFSPDVRRNLGVIGSIAAAIICCTVVARAMKNEHANDIALAVDSGDSSELIDPQGGATGTAASSSTLSVTTREGSSQPTRSSLAQQAVQRSISGQQSGFGQNSNSQFGTQQGFQNPSGFAANQTAANQTATSQTTPANSWQNPNGQTVTAPQSAAQQQVAQQSSAQFQGQPAQFQPHAVQQSPPQATPSLPAQFQRNQPALPVAGQPFPQGGQTPTNGLPTGSTFQPAGRSFQPPNQFAAQQTAPPIGQQPAPSGATGTQEKVNPFDWPAFGGGTERPVQTNNGSATPNSTNQQTIGGNVGSIGNSYSQGQPNGVATFQQNNQPGNNQIGNGQLNAARQQAGQQIDHSNIQQYQPPESPSLRSNEQTTWQQTNPAIGNLQSGTRGATPADQPFNARGQTSTFNQSTGGTPANAQGFIQPGAAQPNTNQPIGQPSTGQQPGIGQPQGIESNRNNAPALQINAPLLGRSSRPALPVANAPKSVGGYPSTGGASFRQLAAGSFRQLATEIHSRSDDQDGNDLTAPAERVASRPTSTDRSRSFSTESLNSGVYR